MKKESKFGGKEQLLIGVAVIGIFALMQLNNNMKEQSRVLGGHMEGCEKASEGLKRILIGVAVLVIGQLILAHVKLNFGGN